MSDLKTVSDRVKRYIRLRQETRGYKPGDLVRLKQSDDYLLVIDVDKLSGDITTSEMTATTIVRGDYILPFEFLEKHLEEHVLLEDISIEGRKFLPSDKLKAKASN